MYRDFRVRVKDIAPHNMLALRRGEHEGVLFFDLVFDESHVIGFLADREIRTRDEQLRGFLGRMPRDALQRLIKFWLVVEPRLEKKQKADAASLAPVGANPPA